MGKRGKKPTSFEEKVKYLQKRDIEINSLSDNEVLALYDKEKHKEYAKTAIDKKKNTIITTQEPTISDFEKVSDMIVEIAQLLPSFSFYELSNIQTMINGLLESLKGELSEKKGEEKERLLDKLNELGYKIEIVD